MTLVSAPRAVLSGVSLNGSGHVISRRLRFGPDTTGSAVKQWHDSLAFLYEALEPNADAPFYIDTLLTQLPHAYLMDCAGSALLMTRTVEYAVSKPVDQIALFRLTHGRVVADYNGRLATLEPGDFVFLDYQLSQISEATEFRCQVIAVPRDFAPGPFRQSDLHGIAVGASSGPGRLLGHYFDGLFELSSNLTFDEAEAAVSALFGFAAAVWPTPGHRAPRTNILDQALKYIDNHLDTPDLGPDHLLRALAVSRTSLYRIFAPTGGIRATILKRRLEAAVLALVRQEWQPGLIKKVAAACGFRSSTQFIKAFRDRYGRTPADVASLRSTAVGGGLFTEWFDARAKEAGYDTVALWLGAQANGAK